MEDRSLEDLRRAGEAGDVDALTELGARRLGGSTPQELEEAVWVLNLAARGGGIEAPAMLATLSAMGMGVPHSWTAALNLLQVAAQRGSESARGQLKVLTPESADTSAPDHWRRLRQAIDVQAWSRSPAIEVVCAAPRIALYDQFISRPICDWLINRARDRIAPAQVFDPLAKGGRVEEARTNGAFEFRFNDLDVVLAMLRFRIAVVVGVHPTALEASQVLHYSPGQRFERHYDFLDPDLPGHVSDLAAYGQRIVTCLIYLNDDFEGGETDFPLLLKRYKPPAGGALCFVNVDPSGTPDRRTLHAGLTPTRGEKWLFSQWIRARK